MRTTLGSSIAILQTTSTLPATMKTLKPLVKNEADAPAVATAPGWVPWVVGAAIGGAVLYFLVRR